MTVFTTRYYKKPELAPALIGLWLALCGMFMVFDASAAQSSGIEIRSASFTAGEDGHTLNADLDIALTPVLEDALNKGVPLYFVLEFEVVRSRWYWTNERIISARQHVRLTYNTLTRQYRVGTGALYQNFSRLPEALNFLSKIRRREEVEPGAFKRGETYSAALRMRLDITQLPKPFQVNALGSRDWNLASDWFRWTITP